MKHQDGSGTSTSRTTESSPKSGIDESNPLQSSSGQPAGQGGGPGAGPESGSDARAALADWFTSVPGRVIAKAERSALDLGQPLLEWLADDQRKRLAKIFDDLRNDRKHGQRRAELGQMILGWCEDTPAG